MTIHTARSVTLALSLLALSGCAPRAVDEEIPEAQRQTDLARKLEASGDKREAAHEYTIVAERYPGTPYEAAAARRAGLLYADPSNPSRSDSLSIHWLRQYLHLSVPQAEREEAEVCLRLVQHAVILRNELAKLAAAQDSLSGVVRRVTSASSGLSWRIGELEGELERTKSELKRLKEIDAKARSRRRP